MARTTQNGQIVVGHIKNLPEIFRAYQVLIGHNSLDGRNDEFVMKFLFEFFQVVFQIRRRCHKNKRIAVAHHLIDVGRKGYSVDIEVYARKI